jgi:hypothetical protein
VGDVDENCEYLKNERMRRDAGGVNLKVSTKAVYRVQKQGKRWPNASGMNPDIFQGGVDQGRTRS